MLLITSLWVLKLFRSEPCSIQREIINRSANTPSKWGYSDANLLELYDYLAEVCRKVKTRQGSVGFAEWQVAAKHPTSSLNFLKNRQLPVNELTKFRSTVAANAQ